MRKIKTRIHTAPDLFGILFQYMTFPIVSHLTFSISVTDTAVQLSIEILLMSSLSKLTHTFSKY